MKKFLLTLVFTMLFQIVFAKKFPFSLTNTTLFPVQVSAQIIKGIEKDDPEFLFVLKPNESKNFEYKLKNGEKIKFIGVSNGIETLPLVKSFENLSSKNINEYQMIVPILDKINVLEPNDLIAKIKNDNILKMLTDSTKYIKDDLPSLGTFLFINKKDNSVLPLVAASWKNESLIRKINNQDFNTTNFINSTNASNLNLSGVPFLTNLSAKFSSSNIIEVVWDIKNAHIKQWQPSDKNVFQILQDPSNNSFIQSCKTEMQNKQLGGGDYQLLFISSAYVVDKIITTGRKYDAVLFNAYVDFQIPTSGVEVIQPIGLDASYKYTRAKTYSNVDSASNVYLKFLAQDYTPALNMYLTQQERNTQKNAAVGNLARIKASIQDQYAAIRTIDNTLIDSQSIDVIMPIVLSSTELSLKPKLFDSTGIDITPIQDIDFNKKALQYNSILNVLKLNVADYKITIESIDKLNEKVNDYQKVINLTQSIELDKKIIEGYMQAKGSLN